MKTFAVFGATVALFFAPALAQGHNDRIDYFPAPGGEPPVGTPTEPPAFPWGTGLPRPTGTAPGPVVPIPTGTGLPWPPTEFQRVHARQFRPIAI